MTITTYGESLETFQEVRRKSASYSEALDRYARSLESYYSSERAKAESTGEISMAEWITYRTEGVSFSGLNLLLLLLGVLSFNEKIGFHPVRTFHASSPRGQRGRNLVAGLTEAVGLLLGLTGICLIIVGAAFFIFPNEHPLRNKIASIVLGIILLVASRLTLRQSKALKIPSHIWKDPTSPFRLHSLKKLDLGKALSGQGGSANAPPPHR